MKVNRAVLRILRREGSEFGFDFASLGFQTADPVANEVGVDACFDRSELQRDPLVDVVKSAAKPVVGVVAGGLDVAGKVDVLLGEVGDAVRSEDVGCEEAVDDFDERVFADVLPLAMPECLGCLVAVGDAVGTG